MSNKIVEKISNSFQAARLVSLASWRQASEFTPRDRGGPYIVTQEGYDPEDLTMTQDEFVLGRSGKWLPVAHFFQLPVPQRRAEFVFGTAAEVMQVMELLPPKALILRPGSPPATPEPTMANDEMAAAFNEGRSQTKNPDAK